MGDRKSGMIFVGDWSVDLVRLWCECMWCIAREKHRKYTRKKSQVCHSILAILKSLRHHTCEAYLRNFHAYLRYSAYLRFLTFYHTCDFFRKYARQNRKYGPKNDQKWPKSQVCHVHISQVCHGHFASMPWTFRKYAMDISQVCHDISQVCHGHFASMPLQYIAYIASMPLRYIASMLQEYIASMLSN